jgi:hypothetical protein
MAIEEECAILLSQVSMAIGGECLPFSLAKSTWPSEENVSPVLPSGEASVPRVFVGPCQVSMIKDKDYAWVILLNQVSMAIGGECLLGVAQNINTPSQ